MAERAPARAPLRARATHQVARKAHQRRLHLQSQPSLRTMEWLYGRHAVEEALRAGRRKVLRVLLADVAKDAKAGRGERLVEIEELARRAKAQIERVPAVRLDALTRVGHHHQGVAAEVTPF